VNDTVALVVVALVVLVVVALLVFLAARKKKSDGLRQQFGPEYDRSVEESGKRRDAERDLQQRTERRNTLDIRSLEPQRRDMFAAEWRITQEDFVDRPGEAVRSANALVERVMQEVGYPVGDFEQMSRDLSVDHAQVMSEYRSAHDLSELNDRKEATTEQQRQAMVHYRSLFTELLDAGDGGDADSAQRGRSPERGRDRS
jgi:hypothetical protein